MRHKKGRIKLHMKPSRLRATMMNMAISLIEHKQIKTTLPKAKVLRPYIEKLITKARNENLASRRFLISKLHDETAVQNLFVLAQEYINRPGGYTRILKAGYRYGDSAPVAYISFVPNEDVKRGFMGIINKGAKRKIIDGEKEISSDQKVIINNTQEEREDMEDKQKDTGRSKEVIPVKSGSKALSTIHKTTKSELMLKGSKGTKPNKTTSNKKGSK